MTEEDNYNGIKLGDMVICTGGKEQGGWTMVKKLESAPVKNMYL